MAAARVEIAIRGAPHNCNEDNEDASSDPQQTNPTRDMDLNGRSNAFEPWQTVSATEPTTSPYFSPIIREGYKRIAKAFTSGHACVQTIEEAVNGIRKLEHAMGKPERELALVTEWAQEDSRQEEEIVSYLFINHGALYCPRNFKSEVRNKDKAAMATTTPTPTLFGADTMKLMKAMTSTTLSTTVEDATIPAPHASPMLSLPHELRLKIYALALRHSETGIVAPNPTSEDAPHHIALLSSSKFWQPGYLIRAHSSLEDPLLPWQIPDYISQNGPSRRNPGVRLGLKIGKINNTSPTDHFLHCFSALDPVTGEEMAGVQMVVGHICTYRCLLQPALTQVNRQLRAESLPVFYGVNDFHHAMFQHTLPPNDRKSPSTSDSASNFDSDVWHKQVGGMPVVRFTNWWRGIGDTNLRLIRSFSLATSFRDGQSRRSMRVRQSLLRGEEEEEEEGEGTNWTIVEVVMGKTEYRLDCAGWSIDGMATTPPAPAASIAEAAKETAAERESRDDVFEVARGLFQGRLCAMTIEQAVESLEEEEGLNAEWKRVFAQ
ncbi:hypothetical protein LTR78_005828 [Recurvomyces mirabilis]|uniref:Uncharacterized protein n=1 Tax=Recurvomyces mirabilis TaxID=574656 RepID=A0AAE0WMA1_9PEZI|nr:hypothetical protein LTR78_005828 [Recurvomyces mirabilis]